MIDQKTLVEEILSLWKNGKKEEAKSYLVMSKHIFSNKAIYDYMYKKMGIVNSTKPPALLVKAQDMMGGRLFDQYGFPYPGQKKKTERIEW
ncbi:MAG: hypothetical protein WC917_04230 [Bacilli bacterium]|jgi:hypothetical protein